MTATIAPTRRSTARVAAVAARKSRRWIPPASLILASLVVWGVALPLMRDASWNMFGLQAAVPLLPVSIALAVLAFCLAVTFKTTKLAALALGATILVTRLPTALATDAPLYSWTYKHFGVIDYIQRYGGVAQDVDIYHNWPGGFALIAWINTITGSDSFGFGLWFAVLTQFVLAGSVYFLARSLAMQAPVALVAGFIAQMGNWVAQDYLSPQAIGFALGVVVVALLVNSRQHPRLAWVALPIFTAIVVTHQLTPYWLLAVLAGLTVLGRVRPRYIFLIYAAIAVGYMLLHLDVLRSFGSLLDFNPLANVQTPTSRMDGTPSLGQKVNSLTARGVTFVLWGSAGVILVLRLIRNRRDWRNILTPGVIAFASLSILAGQSYGGEALFRVFLYSLPGVALILAPVVTTALHGTPGRMRRASPIAVTTIALLLSLLAAQVYYGAWFANLVSKDSIALGTRILKEEDPSTLTIGVAPGAPGRIVAEYVNFVRTDREFDIGIDTWINEWPGWKGEKFADPTKFAGLTDQLVADRQKALVVVTKQMTYYSDYYGTIPTGSVERFASVVAGNPNWELVSRSDDYVEYRLVLPKSAG